MSKKQVAIDSCVFFHLLKYNEIFNESGRIQTISQITEDQKKYITAKEDLNKFMGSVLKSREKKNGGKPFSFEKRLSLCSSLLSNKNKEFPQDIKDAYRKLHDEYAHSKSYSFVGELFIRHLDGKVDFYLPPTVLDEIKYQKRLSDQGTKTPKKGEYFSPASMVDFAKTHCKKLVVPLEKQKYITVLSEIFRGKIEIPEIDMPRPAMKNDVNKNGVYGDSLIMAECALAGLPLVTQNEKDFIVNKGVQFDKNGNQIDERRQAIKKVLAHMGLDESSLPFTIEEFLNNTSDCPIQEKTIAGDLEL